METVQLNTLNEIQLCAVNDDIHFQICCSVSLTRNCREIILIIIREFFAADGVTSPQVTYGFLHFAMHFYCHIIFL